MKVLSINSGSSSIKFKLFYSKTEELLAEGQLKHHSENIYSFELIKPETKAWDILPKDFEYPFDYILEILEKRELIKDFSEIGYIVHRIVHGGEYFSKPAELTKETLEIISNYSEYAPLHNPGAIKIVEQINQIFPQLKQYAVFDTTFHLENPKINFLYGLPLGYYENIKVRKFGFHGISYSYVVETLKQKEKKLDRVVICHLGSGSSIAAVKNGVGFDHSFGFTPNENLLMSTRVGEIDYDAVKFLKRKLELSDSDLDTLLNKESGLLGISGYTQDMKKLIEDYETNPRAKLAIDIYFARVLDQIARFHLSLGGISTLVFTGGVGYAAPFIREKIVEKLEILGIKLNSQKNQSASFADLEQISDANSKTDIFVLKTDEELQMFREIEKIKNSA